MCGHWQVPKGAECAQALDLNLGGYDGIALRLVGDGQTYKLNLKTADQEDTPESTYQATFDTFPGEKHWQTLLLLLIWQGKQLAQGCAFMLAPGTAGSPPYLRPSHYRAVVIASCY